ncbi:MAG TPA: serine hydrolase [Candidatus Choladousia intestinipullorum]|nr:serine hydrolase [Candidatus Choladousia intestinipullorum]
MANRKKKKEIPVTGILAAVVIILLLCAGIVIWLWAGHSETGGQSGGSRPEQTEATGTVTATEAETAEDDTGESGMTKESEPQEKLVVAIDPGHQGSWVDMSDQEPSGPGSSEMKAKASTGTQSSFSDKKEYELNLEISLLLRDELEERGYEVVLTREDHDTAISNAERAQLAYEQGGDIYVRIHANGSDDPSVSGALAMVPSSDNPYVGYLAEDSYLLGQCILDAYCSKASFESLGVQYYDNMTGINWSQIPVMILEMGFMTNQSDDSRMSDPSVQPLMAEGIADGIDRYFTEKGMKEETVTEEAAAKMNALVEQVGEDYLYPSMESGEEWAFSVKNLTTGAQGSIEGDRQMKSASVIKLFIMAAIYDRVCYPASEERHITFEESYDGELKQLITDMITVSDNEAANTLIERLGGGDAQTGMQVVNQFCQENGYTATVLGRRFLEENPAGDNYTSANDCLRLLESIYSGTCVNAEASAKMYEYLVNQTRRNKIPAGLEGTTALSANKTGELAGEYGDQVENDAAVVETDGSVYVLCILSQNLADHAAAIEQIAQISGTVYELI